MTVRRPARRLAWTPERIRDEIARLHARGASLAWARAPTKLRKIGEYYFGSWRAAVEAAGLDYGSVQLKVARHDDDELLAWLRRTARARPKLTLRELRRETRFFPLRARFGSWQAAVAKAGLSGWPITAGRRRWTKEAVIAALRDRYARGLTANTDLGLYAAAKKLFGSLPGRGIAPMGGGLQRSPAANEPRSLVAAMWAAHDSQQRCARLRSEQPAPHPAADAKKRATRLRATSSR